MKLFYYAKRSSHPVKVIILAAFTFLSTGLIAQHEEHHKDESGKFVLTKSYLKFATEIRKKSIDPEEIEFGGWDRVIPEKDGAAIRGVLGMQTVHSVLLPSGKILMTSGSSWRNYKDVQTYPNYENPAPGMGLFNYYDDPFRNNTGNELSKNYRKENYFNLVNNTAIYDPADNSFYRIPHPVPQNEADDESRFVPSDLFCSGHLQLPDGNPLFVGGTQYYFPYRTGTKSSFIFDWRKEVEIDWKSVDWRKMPETSSKNYPWTFSGFMKRGRWYPSIVPLLDGRFVIFSGFVGIDKGFDPMYRFQINPYIEFFNPYEFTAQNPERAWKVVNAKDKPNGPFTTPLGYTPPFTCEDAEFQSYWESQSCTNKVDLPCDCNEECLRDNKYDAFKLYPNNYLVKENQIYLTREGDWVSLRTGDVAYMRKTKNTYFMNVEGTANAPEISFTRGPDRPELITSYGTSYVDPNSKEITILGGQKTSKGTLLPLESDDPYLFAGGRGSRKREQFSYKDMKWEIEKNFLGQYPEDDRTMLTAIILPTKQVLVINGGNYDFYGPVFHPLLLTPKFRNNGSFIEYDVKRMSAAVEPRLYHNAALLIPDGRVWVAGGNSARASVSRTFPNPENQNRAGQPKPDLDLVDIDMYFYNDGQMGKAEKGMQFNNSENWTAEVFSPPYKYIDRSYSSDANGNRVVIDRTALITDMQRSTPNVNTTFKAKIGDKDYFLLASNQKFVLNLEFTPPKRGDKKPGLVLLKLPSFTHDWDNGQFFVDLEITNDNEKEGIIEFRTPDMKKNLIPPGYYMMYYIDSKGKPSISRMVRFDDKAVAP